MDEPESLRQRMIEAFLSYNCFFADSLASRVKSTREKVYEVYCQLVKEQPVEGFEFKPVRGLLSGLELVPVSGPDELVEGPYTPGPASRGNGSYFDL